MTTGASGAAAARVEERSDGSSLRERGLEVKAPNSAKPGALTQALRSSSAALLAPGG